MGLMQNKFMDPDIVNDKISRWACYYNDCILQKQCHEFIYAYKPFLKHPVQHP